MPFIPYYVIQAVSRGSVSYRTRDGGYTAYPSDACTYWSPEGALLDLEPSPQGDVWFQIVACDSTASLPVIIDPEDGDA